MKPLGMSIEHMLVGILVLIFLNLCVYLCFGNTSCCYSSPSDLLVLQRACTCHPLCLRRWGNQPWHTREALIYHLLLSGNGWKLNEYPHAFPSSQEMSKVPKYRQQTHLSIASGSHSEKSAKTVGLRNKSH
jgi:hypothetical protein